ncbi:peptidoglycan/LPS O-acetylase OafA/YrhL [Chitinophaga dinghuensis]|uniref:Peptidoglycan/LPS O-acetylase OafA/YrhL n=1 Tax=Chitinophaga dinghuensis TaxID=1539050 RepID=A0A327VSU7_9BACT|nr:acyltransferase [Chitinophaga dinghuensis]RAJ77447.1 peptidoglycan/LPS O-acetylase OafA/YrhL [Chitinophaga dinghuensis]
MKVYFKNLDAIRFIAALLVMLHHIQFFKRIDKVDSWPVLNYILEDGGRAGVNLFFVLSGFLISYLLLKEQQVTGTINFRNFYIRRILRIWPLYLAYGVLLTLASPFVFHMLGMPANTDMATILTNLLFLLLFAVNIQLAFFPYNRGILEITWSVCIEEQFYLVWPLLLKVFRNRLKVLFFLMLGTGFLCKTLCLVLPMVLPVKPEQLLSVNYLLLFDKLELFGMGMFAAYILFNREQYEGFLQRILQPWIQVLVLLLAILVVFQIIHIPALTRYCYDHFIHAVLFGYIMLMAVAENSILHLEYPILKTLGKISYGLYLLHQPVAQLLLILIMKMHGPEKAVWLYEICYPILCVTLTCGVAYVSYELYEKRFLKVKTKFASVETRM